MELAEKVHGKLVGVDTSIFIYFIEKHVEYNKLLKNFFKKNLEGEIEIVTSTITLLELLVLPFKQSRKDLIKKYKNIFAESEHIELIDLNNEISEISARIKANSGIRTPDAVQIGTSVYKKADYFLTNDKRLRSVKEIPMIILDDYSGLRD
jgi:predicted nucleic acid-binding protein